MKSILDDALEADANGLSVIPILADGSKRPIGKWREYQSRRASAEEITAWYRDGEPNGLGIVCGPVSGGLEALDFDDQEAFAQYEALVPEHSLDQVWARICAGYLEETPSGGRHVLFRSPTPERNTVLAAREETDPKVKVLIETRGQGGYIIVAPSRGGVHPTGEPYTLLRGGFDQIATITEDERSELFALARRLDERPPRQFGSPASPAPSGTRPGDRYNRESCWDDLLPQYGWTREFERDGVTYWCRPGKSRGVSATTNFGGNDRMYVFTSSTPLMASTTYDRFGFYTVMEHGGDFAAAARALHAQGGTPSATENDMGPEQALGAARNGKPASMAVVRSIADIESRPVTWFWPGWLAQGKFTLLGGHPGDGKSTVLAALAAGASRGGQWPDGTSPPRPLRVLFILGEDGAEDTLRPRLELHGAALENTFVLEMVLDDDGRERTFNVGRHIEMLDHAVVEHQIDWIIIDPLTTIMPGTDRNAEGDTRDALTPLSKLGERLQVAITGVAHVGKSGAGSRRPVQMILGATAFSALARTVWMIAPNVGQGVALGVVKSNLAPKPASIVWTRETDGPIVWHGRSSRDIEELFAEPAKKRPRKGAEEFLADFLADGPRPMRVVERAAEEAGIKPATLRRAKDELGIQPTREGGSLGRWMWSLPQGQLELPDLDDQGKTPPAPRNSGLKLLNPQGQQVNTFEHAHESEVPQGADWSSRVGALRPLSGASEIKDAHLVPNDHVEHLWQATARSEVDDLSSLESHSAIRGTRSLEIDDSGFEADLVS